LSEPASPLTYAVAVQVDADHPGQRSALQFVAAVLTAGHRVDQVFFFQDGVTIAIRAPDAAGGLELSARERLLDDWRELAKRHSISLAVCSGAAVRRSPEGTAAEQQSELPTGFELMGLGQLIESIALSDRFVSFAP
jgi:tRNA 2-thiouridine synthesizing protein D